jgi:2-polyprenyl-6-methoxyphenol hydroxylase-like FAD-dependent oxidoreductase
MSARQHHETPVLVVGAGPAGLATAAGLARNGVGSLVIERHPTTSIFPKASGISTRTMEILRSWGLEAAVRAASLSALPMMSVRATLTGAGQAVAPLGFPTDDQALAVSPTRPAIAPQDRVEPILLDFVRSQPGTEVRFGTELVAIEQDADGVTATIRDLGEDRLGTVRARYLVGADGTKSTLGRTSRCCSGPTCGRRSATSASGCTSSPDRCPASSCRPVRTIDGSSGCRSIRAPRIPPVSTPSAASS